MSVIFHIAHRRDLAAAHASGTGEYWIEGLDREGFIHLSTFAQFPKTAERYYRGVTDLVLVEFDEAALASDLLRYEVSTNDQLFPHYYGALPLHAVVRVHEFPCRSDGGFDVPLALTQGRAE